MNENKNAYIELDDEFLAQLDFHRPDYDAAVLEMEEQKADILRLIASLVKHDIPIPDDILARYVKQSYDENEDLPFK